MYEATSPRSYTGVADFGRVAGRQPNVAGYFSGWAEPFATSFAEQAYRHHAAVLVQLDPSYASVAAIANGSYDNYLRSYADSVRHFGHAVIIGFGHEMNAPWYSWGYPHVRPATFVAAWRHIVRLFRGQGADNVTWLWTINTDLPRSGPVARWWPGSAYVTWVGVDGYFYRPSDTFTSVFGTTIGQVRTFTRKPVLLAETAAGPVAGHPARSKACSQACGASGPSAWCGSTRTSTRGSTTRTGTLRAAPPRRLPSGGASARWYWRARELPPGARR